MYPKVKVKVRNHEQDDQHAVTAALDHKAKYMQPLKIHPSLLIDDSSAFVEKQYDDSPPSIVRVRIPDVSMTTVSLSEELEKNDDKLEDDKVNIRAGPKNGDKLEVDKVNIRAGSTLPRAVISSPGKKQHNDSPPSIARIHIPDVAMTAVSLSEEKNDDRFEDDKVNLRAGSIPPPRAVISSTDNDAIFGNKNRTGRRATPSETHKAVQNRHDRCKVSMLSRKVLIPEGSGKFNEEKVQNRHDRCKVSMLSRKVLIPEGSGKFKEEKGSATAFSNKRTCPKICKSSSLRN